MKQGHIIIGTAGHIDHGKTSLVKALTGINTDRLKEEKERGITIELGFAPLTLPSGMRLGLVDVPGHERFVKNMVAGAAGIDLVLLVIAADEGVMPQTREHLDICQLLGVRGGVVALTKTDMVEEDWIDLVVEDVKEYLTGTFLQDAPIVPFSSVTEQGKEELLEILDDLARQVPARSDAGIFRLPVDRVFSMKGFGSVVTGTLISGRITSGEEVIFYPGDMKAKLRGLQVHGETLEESIAGTRTALNLQGIDKADIDRGQTAGRPGTLEPSLMIDAHISLLPTAPRAMKNRERVRLNIYTAEIMGRAVILEGEVLEPGTEGLVQLRLEEPAVALPGDRFVLRSYSPMMTIGGGYVLDPLPSKHRRGRQVVIDLMKELETDDPSKRVSVYLSEAGDHGSQASRLAIRSGLTVKELMNVLKVKEEESAVVVAGEDAAALVYSADSFEKLKDRLTKAVARFHETNPAKAGIGREELRMRVARQLPDRPYRNLLSALQEKKEIFINGDIVNIYGHQATLSPQQESLGGKLLELFRGCGLSVPMVPELEEELSVDAKQLKEVLNLLTDRGELVRIKDDYFVLPDVHTELMDGIDRYFQADKEMAMPDFREITGTTRKWMIPLLEYLDRTQITMRKGDVRIKRRRSQD